MYDKNILLNLMTCIYASPWMVLEMRIFNNNNKKETEIL